MFPNSQLDFTIWKNVFCSSMLLTIYPHSLILALVFASVDSITMFDAIDEVAFISAVSGCPFVGADSVHLILAPLTVVLVAVGPHKSSLTVYHIQNPVSEVFASFAAYKFAKSIFSAIYELSCKY